MSSDKELKEIFRKEFSNNPEKYYPSVMKDLGFKRHHCTNCGKNFWSISDRNKCGDASCSGGFLFINNTPAKHKMDYIQLWKNFSSIMEKQGYTPVKRVPIIARWRDDLFFVEASIDAFIPYVVNGEVEPPANPLVVPQLAVRFNDIDNVGITGSHNTCFIMAGQHAFYPPEKYKPNDYLQHLLKWFTDGMKIPINEIILHEDVWAGSGNFGPSIEVFSRGIELGNQVYMQYRSQEDGKYTDLPLKVLDMGLGYERNVWFSNATSTSYETTFPAVVKKLYSITGLKPDHDLVVKFLPFASFLNADEVDDINKVWHDIAKKIQTDVSILKETVMPLSAIYSIADHTRALLVAISDGGLPSNVGGGYNLRVILRRAMSLAEKYGWDIDFTNLCEEHARYLKPLFPELQENMKEVGEILENEKKKYEIAKQKSTAIIESSIKKDVDIKKLIALYDSHGIPPQLIVEEAKKKGMKIVLPDNFFALVTEKHRKAEKKAKHVMDVSGLPATEIRYYDLPYKTDINAKVLKIVDKNKVVLDRTIFYPESGGQESDTGLINNCKVLSVQRFGKVIVHSADKADFNEGDEVECKIDWPRRLQLSQHHTAVHVVNGAARAVLGKHIWQGGTHKSEEKATLDISHYEQLTDEQLLQIEKLANKTVRKSADISRNVMNRIDAEQKYGMLIYQGGVIPHKQLRIIEIPGAEYKDVEACGGTHLENTHEIGKIIIANSERIQDGVIRLIIVAGKAAEKYMEDQNKILTEIEEITGVKGENTVKVSAELFGLWKKSKKQAKSRHENIIGLANNFLDGILVEKIEGDIQALKNVSQTLSGNDKVIVLFGIKDKKINVFGSAGSATSIDIGKKIGETCAMLGGKGGGSKHVAQGFGIDFDKLDEVIERLKGNLRK
ncbi:MAG: alanine--tRNA ligase [Candidatus Aenigmarchaeota archaeon]|nr:alanine--tRNA ligase [Candidatus Aenigmarchaeota archaeon]